MSEANRRYLDDYRSVARAIKDIRKDFGWARGKGQVKADIRFIIMADGPFTAPGMIDAILDSVGC